tara:strand:+ start:204 stop:554 length:351 start_codon:yes stop_codon:yes gene_type:complete
MPKYTQYEGETNEEFQARQKRQSQEGAQKDANDWIKDHGVEDYALGQTRLGVDPFVNMSKKDIADYQEILKKRGFYTGEIDSIAGPLTQEAHKNMIKKPEMKSYKDILIEYFNRMK